MSMLKPPRPASRTVTSGRSASAVARSTAPRAASCSPVSRSAVSRSNGLSGRSSKISIASPCKAASASPTAAGGATGTAAAEAAAAGCDVGGDGSFACAWAARPHSAAIAAIEIT
jgi:hypothetical protein